MVDYTLPGPYPNTGTVQVNSGGICTIDLGVTFINNASSASLNNYGTCYNYGTISNNEAGSSLSNLSGGTFNNYAGALIINLYSASYNPSFINNYTSSVFNNSGDIINIGQLGSVSVIGGTFNNNTGATITNSGDSSFLLNDSSAAFTNNGTIVNNGSGSYTTNKGTWTGSGICDPANTCTGIGT